MGPFQLNMATLVLGGFTTALTVLITWAVHKMTAKLDEVERERKAERAADEQWRTAMERGMRAMLRKELLDAYEQYVIRGDPLSYDVFKHLEGVYDAYHALGGNGAGTMVWEAICRIQLSEI